MNVTGLGRVPQSGEPHRRQTGSPLMKSFLVSPCLAWQAEIEARWPDSWVSPYCREGRLKNWAILAARCHSDGQLGEGGQSRQLGAVWAC